MKRLALLLLLCATTRAQATPQLGGPISPDGKVMIQAYLPLPLRLFNTGGSDGPRGPGSGSGLCVFSSIEHAARYQNDAKVFGFQEWMTHKPGGGTPGLVDKWLGQYAPGTQYVQHTKGDMAFLRAVLATGRMPCVTYAGHDPHYSGRGIAHMVNLVHLDDTWACVMDNNAIFDKTTKQDNQLVWMSVADFASRWKENGGGWAVALLAAPPPMPPLYQLPDDLPDAPGWTAPVFTWDRCGNQSQVFLMSGKKTLGGWDYPGRFWRSYDEESRQWGPSGEPPMAPPLLTELPHGTVRVENHGIGYWNHERTPAYSISGVACSRAEAFAAVEQCPGPGPCPAPKPKPRPGPSPSPSPGPSPFPDDTGLMRVTVVGPDAFRAQVRKDLDAAHELAPWKGKLSVQDYPEGATMLVSLGLPSVGTHIIIQSPPASGFPGRILADLKTYDGAAGLATKLRSLDPNAPPLPQPTPDVKPDSKILPFKSGGLSPVAWILLAPIGVFLIFVLILFTRPLQPAQGGVSLWQNFLQTR